MAKKQKNQVEKKVESYYELTQTQFEILKYLTQFLTISQIAGLRKTSRTAVYKVINQLLRKGAIRKIDKIYEVTDQGKQGLHSFIGFTNRIRLHNLAVKINILNKPTNWELKRSKLASIRVLSKEIRLKNNKYQIHSFSNVKIKTTTNSIIFYLPSTYGNSTEETFQQSLDLLWKSIPKIESLFNIILTKDRKTNIEIISNHYARLNDSLAKKYRKEGNKLYIKDKEGKIWLVSDASFRVDETEAIDTIKAKEDMDIVHNFFNDLRKNPATVTEILNLVRENSANNIALSMNFKSHIKAIQELGGGVDKLTKAVSGIARENKLLKLKLKNKEQTNLSDF